MSSSNWNQRFFNSTRGRIVISLRKGNKTVDELAQELALTDNAIRAHLVTLERDGFVKQQGARRGASKPAYVYELGLAAEQLFHKAYEPVLQQLLEVLSARLPQVDLDAALRMVGQRIAQRWNISTSTLLQRLEIALAALNELGGLAEIEEQSDHSYIISSHECPLASSAREGLAQNVNVCQIIESFLSELIELPVQTQCECNGALHCRFLVQT